MKNKIKMYKLFGLLVALLAFFSLYSGMALAADPGCYQKDTSGKTSKINCPTEGYARQTAAPDNKCFLSTVSSQGSTAFTAKDCSLITVGQSPTSAPTSAPNNDLGTAPTPDNPGAATHQCGRGDGNEVKVAFDFGCIGGDPNKFDGATLNPIVDIAFAIFRFLSAGAGIVVIGSIVLAGIQYSASKGDPQATGAAIKRISNSLIGLLIYLLMFAIANFLVPGGMFL